MKQDKEKKHIGHKEIAEKTSDRLYSAAKAPWYGYIAFLFIYILASVLITIVSRSDGTMLINGNRIPLSAFAGVFSSLSNICIIMLVIAYGTLGFVTSLVMMLLQFPVILTSILKHNIVGNIPGIFSNTFSIIVSIAIFVNKKRNEKLRVRMAEQAITDRLTGLPNRFACSELFRELIGSQTKFVVVSIDINNFKNINDTMGFDIGNKVLTGIAMLWKNIAESGASGTNDFVARLSGDEFAIIIRDYKSEKDIETAIKKYESSLSNKLNVDGYDLYITASFGYAEYPTDADNIDNLFTFADAAMTELKRANSSEHILRYSPDILKLERTLEIEHKIRTALEKDNVFFNLQPQYDMEHKLRGFEALARMKDENGDFISPGEFIPVAEKVGLVDKLDGAVFRKSSEFFGELLRKYDLDIILSVNVSVRHLMKKDFIEEIKSILQNSNIPPKNLEIEITESIMIDSVDKALQVINAIEEMGVQIAIDDFGTGYSSLSYLNRFPANLLKIDKSFIDKVNDNDSSKQYVASIIAIGHIMGFNVISEGVEEDEQISVLKEIGCDYIQGYIWGKPLPEEQAEKLVRDSLTN
ncbi:MAG: EAL domain-containing protein [Ruminococcus sp.]|nr:EAL domain-containing protein [Ruminococcus sp.]